MSGWGIAEGLSVDAVSCSGSQRAFVRMDAGESDFEGRMEFIFQEEFAVKRG